MKLLDVGMREVPSCGAMSVALEVKLINPHATGRPALDTTTSAKAELNVLESK